MAKELSWEQEGERRRIYDHPSSRRAAEERETGGIGPRARLEAKQHGECEKLRVEQKEEFDQMQQRHRREQQGDGVKRDAWTGRTVDAALLNKQQRQQTAMIERHRTAQAEQREQHRQEWNQLRAQHTAPTRPAA